MAGRGAVDEPRDGLAEVAAELYGLLPGDFTAARNERAKELRGTDRELSERVRRLPRPSTAAWAVNMLVRHHREEVEQILQLGAALREAQQDLDADQIRELNRQRHGVVAAVTRQSRALAKRLGQPVSEAVAVEVEQTLRAAMADAPAAAAVRTGQLTSALSSTGLGPVDLTGAVAVPSAAPPPAAPSDRAAPGPDRAGRDRADGAERAERQRKQEVERLLAQARDDAEEAERALREAEQEVARLRERRQALRDERESLATRLRELQEEARQVEREVAERDRAARTADRDEDAAERNLSTARRAAERSRQRVERLSRG